MKFKEYIDSTGRTWNHQEDEQANLEHAMLGLIDEVGEISSAIKKHVGYNKELDLVNIKEEIGDATYFLARVTACMFNGDQLDSICTHMDGVADGAPTNSETEAIDNCQYIDIIYAIMFPLTRLYSGVVEGKGVEVAQGTVDSFAGLKLIALYFDMDIKDCMDANIAKLKERYADKFTEQEATVRDLKAEKKVLKKK